jgi:hypothetical protein
VTHNLTQSTGPLGKLKAVSTEAQTRTGLPDKDVSHRVNPREIPGRLAKILRKFFQKKYCQLGQKRIDRGQKNEKRPLSLQFYWQEAGQLNS